MPRPGGIVAADAAGAYEAEAAEAGPGARGEPVIGKALALVHGWLVLDFFADARREGGGGSSLTTTIFSQSFIALVLAALLFDRDAALVPYVTANLSLSAWLAALSAFVDPERRDRHRADAVLAATAPMPRATIGIARAMHTTFYLVLTTTGMALPPAILSSWVAGGRGWIVPAYVAAACVLAGIVTGLAAVTARIAQAALGLARGAVLQGTLRAAVLGLGFVGFAVCLPHLDGGADALPLPRLAVDAWPPYWAGRVLASPATEPLLLAALLGTALAVLSAFIATGTGPVDDGRQRAGRPGLADAIERRLLGPGALRGATEFVGIMLGRSAGYRGRVLPLFGLPAAMIVLAYLRAGGGERLLLLGMAMQFPGIYVPFLVLFLPHGDGNGGWLFETSPRHSMGLCREAALVALAVRVLLPAYAVAGVLVGAAGFGVTTAIALTAFSWGVAVLIAGFAVKALDEIPFSRAGDTDAGMAHGGIIGTAMVTAAAGGAFAWIAGSWAGAGLALAMATAAVGRLVATRSRVARAGR